MATITGAGDCLTCIPHCFSSSLLCLSWLTASKWTPVIAGHSDDQKRMYAHVYLMVYPPVLLLSRCTYSGKRLCPAIARAAGILHRSGRITEEDMYFDQRPFRDEIIMGRKAAMFWATWTARDDILGRAVVSYSSPGLTPPRLARRCLKSQYA